MRTLFVRGIPRAFDDEALERVFEGEGMMRCFLIKKGERHKGIGFVEFESEEKAQDAMDKLNGKRVGDRELKIEFAKERTPFKERRKRKIQSLKESELSVKNEQDPFESLGPHAKVKSVAVGGVTVQLLP